MLYAEPRHVEDVNQCYFYHTMDLPELGMVRGNWDLRENISAYLGGFKFEGKRALDVGCASGILSMYMESKGAEVVSYDLDKSGDWDMVPFAKWEHYEHIANERKTIIDRLNNAYWLSHRLHKSKAKMVYGNVYAIPEAIGPVDVSVFGSNLLHLRDPFFALQNGLRLTREAVIVTDVLRSPSNAVWPLINGSPEGIPSLDFLPDARTVEPKDTWWDITPQWVIRAVGVLGFEDVHITYHAQPYEGVMNQLFTVVARRTHGRAIGELEMAA